MSFRGGHGRETGIVSPGLTLAQDVTPDRASVRAVGKPPAGHVWGWEIEPLTDGECLVSHYCDWTNVSDELRVKFRWPVVPADRLAHSVENVKRLVTPGPGLLHHW
jgi:hypothetical protein